MKIPTMDEADELVKSTDYAYEATHQDINPINWGDAMGFFIEGCQYMVDQSLPTEGEIEAELLPYLIEFDPYIDWSELLDRLAKAILNLINQQR